MNLIDSKRNRTLLMLTIAAILGFLLVRRDQNLKTSESRTVIPPTPVKQSAVPMAVVSPSTHSASRESVIKPQPEPPISNDQAYCRLRESNLGVPLQGELKILSHSYGSDEDGSAGFWAWVQSSECPPHTFSQVQMDSIGRVKHLVDCRRAKPEEILTHAAIQAATKEVPVGPKELKLSIFRGGFFVLQCQDSLFLSRSGDFRTEKGKVKYKDCLVLAQDGSIFDPKDEELNEQGCTRYGTCIALILAQDPANLKLIDRFTLQALDDPFRFPVQDRKLFLNALEDFSDPRVGPLGPDWQKMPRFKAPDCKNLR